MLPKGAAPPATAPGAPRRGPPRTATRRAVSPPAGHRACRGSDVRSAAGASTARAAAAGGVRADRARRRGSRAARASPATSSPARPESRRPTPEEQGAARSEPAPARRSSVRRRRRARSRRRQANSGQPRLPSRPVILQKGWDSGGRIARRWRTAAAADTAVPTSAASRAPPPDVGPNAASSGRRSLGREAPRSDQALAQRWIQGPSPLTVRRARPWTTAQSVAPARRERREAQGTKRRAARRRGGIRSRLGES
jgi:hypothetical protein